MARHMARILVFQLASRKYIWFCIGNIFLKICMVAVRVNVDLYCHWFKNATYDLK